MATPHVKESLTNKFDQRSKNDIMKKWLRSGLVWGGILYVITMMAFPLLDGERLSMAKILIGIPFWIAIGMGIGYMLKNRKDKKHV